MDWESLISKGFETYGQIESAKAAAPSSPAQISQPTVGKGAQGETVVDKNSMENNLNPKTIAIYGGLGLVAIGVTVLLVKAVK